MRGQDSLVTSRHLFLGGISLAGWPTTQPSGRISPVDLGAVLTGLKPMELEAVAVVYFEGRTVADAARVLGVDRSIVATALGSAFRVIGRRVLAADSPSVAGDDASRRVREGNATARFPGAAVGPRAGVSGPPG